MQAVKDKKSMKTAKVDEKISDLSEEKALSSLKSFFNEILTVIKRSKTSEPGDSKLDQYERKVLAQKSTMESSIRMTMRIR